MSAALAQPHDRSEAERFLALLDESAERFCFRVFDDNEQRKDPHLAAKYDGALADVWPALLAKQGAGCGVYVVANAGEQTNDTIYKVRAVFADTDGADLGPILACGLEPHVIVESSPGKWHVYWLVDGLPTKAFREIQRNIAARFGTDKSVNDLARVMRLPGLLHQKGQPFLVRIIHESGGLPYSADTILEHFGRPAAEAPPATPSVGLSGHVETDRHADVLKLTLLLAQSVRNGAMTRDEALALMRSRRDSGRWSRHVPDDEIARALDGALQKGGAVQGLPTTPPEPPQLQSALDAAATPFTDDEFTAAAIAHPHAFMSSDARRGLFPAGEVTVLGAPGREGKTTIVTGIATHYALGLPLADMAPAEVGSVMVYSGEDDRAQYARKFQAQRARLTEADAKRLQANVIVPDLHGEALSGWREIVRLEARQPVRGRILDALIETIRRLRQRECPLGLVIFETASTLSDAEEDNIGHRVMVDALKRVAKATGVAVVLTHHTSQESASRLPTLDLSETAFRGGTALVNNARQTLLAVNLGSLHDPFPDSDSRTVLRSLVAPGESERVTLVACMSSSKSVEPHPMFFRWEDVEPYGPRAVEIRTVAPVFGRSWRSLHKQLSGAKAEAAADKKAEAAQAKVRLVVRAAAELAEEGVQPTVAKVSAKCGHGDARWAKQYLEAAVELGELLRTTEQVKHTRGLSDVYRPADSAFPPAAGAPWQSPTA